MSRSKNALWGFVADISGQIITQVLSFVFIPLYLLYISEQSYGCWLTIGSIMTWLAVSDIGIGMALNRYLMGSLIIDDKEKRKEKINQLINTSLLMFLLVAILFLIIGYLLYPCTVNWLNIEPAYQKEYHDTYFICIISGALSLPLYVFNGLIESFQKIALNRNIATISTILNIIVSFILISIFKNATALAIGLLINIISRGILSYYFANTLFRLNWSFKFYNKSDAKQLLSYGGYFQVSRVANTLAENSDNLFISRFLGASMVPIYSFSAKLPQLFAITLSSKIAISMFSGISELIDSNQFDKLRALFRVLVRVLFRMMLFSAAFIYFYNQNFVELWVGSKFFGGEYLNMVFVYWIFYETFFRGTTIIVYALKEVKGLAISSILESLLNVVLSVILIKKYGLFGVALATSISRTVTSGVFILFVYIKYKLLNLQTLKVIFETFLFSIPTIIFLYVCSISLPSLSWIQLFVLGVSGLIINLISFEGKIILKNKNQPLIKIIQLCFSNIRK